LTNRSLPCSRRCFQRRRYLPSASTAFGIRGWSLWVLGAITSVTMLLSTSEVCSICVDRFRSSWRVVGPTGHYLVNGAAFNVGGVLPSTSTTFCLHGWMVNLFMTVFSRLQSDQPLFCCGSCSLWKAGTLYDARPGVPTVNEVRRYEIFYIAIVSSQSQVRYFVPFL
jgi:hypothetical protein